MKGTERVVNEVESVLQWERDWFRRASMGELARREGGRLPRLGGFPTLYERARVQGEVARPYYERRAPVDKTPLERQRGAGHITIKSGWNA